MRKLSYLFFLSISILFSCSDDDGGDVNANGQIVLGGDAKLNLNHAVIEGKISTGSYYSFLLSFFDKEIEYKNLTSELSTLETYLFFNFFSPCSEAIRLGEFEYISPTEIVNGVPDEGYFTIGTLTRKVGDVSENPPILTPANEFTWNGVTHEIVDLAVVDYGPLKGNFDQVKLQ